MTVNVWLSALHVIVAPAGGLVNDDGPAVVDKDCVPPAGKLAGSTYFPSSADPMSYFKHFSDVSPSHEPENCS